MAVIGNTYLTLKDKLAQTENGRAATAIVDLLAQSNALIEDAIVRECNEGSTHKTTVRNGLSEVEFRKFYQGVASSKGEYTQITDTTGIIRNIPTIPLISPPSATATNTHIPERPMEVPTTRGYTKLFSTC